MSEANPEGLYEPAPRADLLDFDDPTPATADVVPMELPPEVIAAEAALITVGHTPAPPLPVDEALPPLAVSRPPFVTETMAELYLAQGFREQALAVYVDLLAASPDDQRLAAIVESLAPVPQADAGPNVRDFFARMAGRRPGSAAAAQEPPAYDDFANDEPVADPAELVAVAAPESPEPVQELTAAAKGTFLNAANCDSNWATLGPVPIQQDSSVSTTAAISSFPISGEPKTKNFSRVLIN